MTLKLMPDAQVPALSVPVVGGDTWTLSEQKPQNFTMLVFYRGYHCPICKTQLEELDALAEGYAEAGFSVLALSMESAERAAKTAAEWNVGKLTIGHSLPEAVARDWGLYISTAIKEAETPVFCEPGVMWVRPDGRLFLIDVANMPFPRPDLAFLLSKVPLVVQDGYPVRGTT